MKRMSIALTGILLALICTMQVWAQDMTPAFSSVEYLSVDAAAVKVAQMMQVSKQDAANKIKAAQAKIPTKGEGLLSTRKTPAYVYSHVDIGNRNYLELGAVVLVVNQGGAMQISEVISSYCRPVNNFLKWTPSSELTVAVVSKTQLRFSVAGEAFAAMNPVSERYVEYTTKDFTDAGFTSKPDHTGFSKQISITTGCDITKASRLTENDIAEGYIAMLTHFQKLTRQSMQDRAKVAVALETPVGLTEQGKKIFFAHVAKRSGGEVLETAAVTYHAAWNQDTQVNPLADCLIKIDNVSIAGDKLNFGMNGYTGFGVVYGFSSAEMKRNAKGVWEMLNPDQVDIKVS